MKKLDLQLFAEAVKGKKLIYLYRMLSDAATTDAKGLAFTSENGITTSRDADTVETKDGPIRTPGSVEIELSSTSYLEKDDTMIVKLREALINGEKVEVWEVNLDEAGTAENTFKGTYYQGYVTELEKSSPSDDYIECSITFGLEGTGADGDVTVTADQQELANYVFTDTQKTGA